MTDLLVSGDPVLLEIIGRSLAVSACAGSAGFMIGLGAGAVLGVTRFPFRGAAVAILNTLLAMPSVVVGLAVYLLLSASGPLGFLGWLYSFSAMVLAQTLLTAPVGAALTHSVVETEEREHGEQLRSLGAGPGLRALLLSWDEHRALLTVLITCFSRAVSEVGAVMIVGGNIDGFTRVMDVAATSNTVMSHSVPHSERSRTSDLG